ncbi:GNAT family N-acetyltransferase [Chloroflexota bacterium]
MTEFRFNDYQPFYDGEIEVVVNEKLPANPERELVPSYEFEVRLPGSTVPVGRISLRIGSTRRLVKYGGNIGYGVYPDYRGHHYAAKACKLVKQVALDHDMKTLWITCNPDNIASRRTCEILGLKIVEIVDLPEDIDMYGRVDRQKCRYRWDL